MTARREVQESVRIVIKTPEGHRLEVSGKAGATGGMLIAFGCLPRDRREWLLREMADEHASIIAREATATGSAE